MKTALAAAALAIAALVPGLGSACDYSNEASTAAPEQMASTQVPASIQAPASKAVKATTSAAKPVALKTKTAPEPKLATATSN